MKPVYLRAALGTALLACLGSILYLSWVLSENQARISAAGGRRLESYKLADELRQSSDDLTRMARTYVITGDSRFEEYFHRIIAIREGAAPRPENYASIYWDFFSATDRDPRPGRNSIALEDLMRASGFTAEEFQLLRRAKQNSDNLVALEERAMAAAKGLFPDPRGAYVVEGEPDASLAAQLLHGPEYHRAKAEIMGPIEEFFQSVETRTAAEALRFERRSARLIMTLVGLCLVSLALAASLIFASGFSGPTSTSAESAMESASQPRSWLIWSIAAIAVLLVIGFTWISQTRLELRSRQDMGNTLTTVLEATGKAVGHWILEREGEVELWAHHSYIRDLFGRLVESNGEVADVSHRQAQKLLVEQLIEVVQSGRIKGFLAASIEGTVLASDRDRDVGRPVGEVMPEGLLKAVLEGPRHTMISLPTESRGSLDADRWETEMHVATLVRGEAGADLGVLVFRLDPQRDFTEILQRGRVGDSGESYAFNSEGLMVSESRFDDDLRTIGLLEPEQTAILNISVRDPGVNLVEGFASHLPRDEQPLTLMAREATSGSAGLNVEGYNDYRGVPVIGAWSWDAVRGMGITTELDVSEAYQSLRAAVRMSSLGAAFSTLLILMLSAIFIRSRKKVAASMRNLERANEELEGSSSVILRWAPDGTVLHINDYGCELFGYSRHEILGQPLVGTIVPEEQSRASDLQDWIDNLEANPEHERESSEHENCRSDGSPLWIAWRHRLIRKRDGSLKEILAVGIDISERREAELQLDAAHRKMEAVNASAADAIILSDSAGNVMGWNRAAETTLGWTAEEMRGRPLRTFIPERYRQDHAAGMARVNESGEGRVMGKPTELAALHKDGHELTIDLSLSTFVIGTERFYTGILRDITERKAMEAELEKARLRMEDELNVGREIQKSMLPLIFPAYPEHSEFDLFASLEAAREVGGDFYDFFLIDEDHLCVCVGDVSGKGVPAALFMAVTKTLIKSRASTDQSTASILDHVNEEMSQNNNESMFVTVFLGILTISTGDFIYSNAGHSPPFLKRDQRSLIRVDKRHGPIMGAVEGLRYGEDRLKLEVGDVLFLYTDGVTEAMNSDSDLYSEDRLQKLLDRAPLLSAEETVRAVLDDVWGFQGDAEQADDVTLLAMSYSGPSTQDSADPLELRIENRFEEIGRVNEAFNIFAESYDVPDTIRRKLNLVFDELLNNIITYGYEDDNQHWIDIAASVVKGVLHVSITDDGRPFNPLETPAPDTDLSLEEREPGGLGIHLLRSLMDNVTYERREPQNIVRLDKRLPFPEE